MTRLRIGALRQRHIHLTADAFAEDLTMILIEQDGSDSDRRVEIDDLLANHCSFVGRREELFDGRKVTSDGHLVGSIGGVIAAKIFALKFLPAGTPNYDAKASDGRMVQIRLRQSNRSVGFCAEPEHLFVLGLTPERIVEVVSNGLVCAPWSDLRKVQSKGQKSVSFNGL